MPQRKKTALEPRKSPVQARSTASVEAILEATLQVLVNVGKERLTTTRVALRAGVSVGTLYQYFPNKSGLLKAVLARHMDGVTAEVARVCREQKGGTLRNMVGALASAFLDAKMTDGKRSAALYAVSSDVDGARIVQRMALKSNRLIVEMLQSSCEPLQRDAQSVASTLQGAMAGISRRLLESPSPEKIFPSLRAEMIFCACAYIEACR